MSMRTTVGSWGDRVIARMHHAIRQAVARHQGSAALARCASVGAGTSVRGHIRLTGGESIHLGSNVVINDNANIRGEGGLSIGDNTKIARNVVIYTINHRIDGERLPFDEVRVAKPVTIGRNVWIGTNVCIVPGATIGDGAVIGMGTVVAGDVPDRSIVAGGPWRVVGERDRAAYERVDASGRYAGVDGKPPDPPHS